MNKLLFVGPPFVGHLSPALSLAMELAARGHEIRWVGDEKLLKKLGSKSMTVYGCTLDWVVDRANERLGELRGSDAILSLWKTYLSMAQAMYPLTVEALDAFRPDLVLSDQQTFAGSLAAREAGYRWLTLATTSGEIDPGPQSQASFHRWLMNALAEFGAELGLRDASDPRFSPFGTLLFSSCALTGALPTHPQIAGVGCSIKHRSETAAFPWEKLDRRRKVLVSLGTLNDLAGKSFLEEAWLACHERRETIQTILLDPSDSMERVSDDDILVLRRVPQLALLEHLDAIVCHGGQNTISEAISHGVPLVVAPIRDDQPMNAAQVVDAGVGVRVRFGRPRAAAIGAAIDRVLGDPAYRAAALDIQPSMANGTDRAADAVEHFLRSGALHNGMDSHDS
ncbi:glycosyltransferase [Dyella sp. GSA-30]|uniref:glycosyltransferase n=1 Tax=Dyella sp. GSA-30 TaxID=2994496 RepID=UPI002493120F|nr:glycosyltransferase [Dyella sp. GSA-30]BDU18888.1 glycosyl transferase [Dyella sp. GSA-30]